MALTGKQKRFLRAEAHHLSPVVMVGKGGIGDSIVTAVREQLRAHELIKVRVLEGSELERVDVGRLLAEATRAEDVGGLGRIAILYKRHPETPKIRLPQGG